MLGLFLFIIYYFIVIIIIFLMSVFRQHVSTFPQLVLQAR